MKKRSSFLLSLSLMAAAAVAAPALAGGFLEVEKNVAWHGSVDDKGEKKLFLVVGIKPGTEASVDWLKTAIDRDEVIKLGDKFYDAEHKHDIAHATQKGVESARELAPKIFMEPFESMKKGDRLFHADLASANNDYYHDANPHVAPLKYSAKVAFILVKSTYYMIVEPSAEFVGYTLGTVGTIPAHLAWQGLTIGFKGTWIGVKFGAHVLASIVVETYSILSSGVAVVVTSTAAGVMTLARGVKGLGNIRHNLQYPIRLPFQTSVKVDDCETSTQKLVDFLKAEGYQPEMKYDKTKFTSSTTLLDGSVLITVYPRSGVLFVSIEATKDYMQRDHTKGHTKREVRDILEGKILALKAKFEQILPEVGFKAVE